ncbi:MAG: hypothetical protein ACRDSK_31255 [Actinophytocola sp.]|uniref:hypothetical protein n=1 Tax=Actinophytocola sp. TaxID=1872138 RepID=UPI003D6A89D4
MHPTTATTIHPAIFDLRVDQFGRPLTEEGFAAIFAGIPARHPRNENPGGGGPAGGSAGPGGGGGGGASSTAAQPAGTGDQPGAAGRGDVDHLAGLYDLSTAPEALRPHLQEELRKINAGVGRRFQEHAEFRQRFEPLEGIEGLADTPAEDLEDLLSIRGFIAEASDEQNPNSEKLEEWWDKLGEHFGFFGDDGGGSEPGGLPEGDDPPAWAQQLMQENQELRERLEQGERSTAEQQAEQQVQAEMQQLAEQHSLDEDAQNAIYQLAYAYGGADDALQKGLADYFRISGKAESGLLENGNGRPTPGPTTPGNGQAADPNGDKPLRFGDPALKQAAMARVRGQSTGAAA